MKKKMKRLSLNRETVRNLNQGEMSAALGGASERFCPVETAYAICATESCPTRCQWYCEGVQ
jgi:hypothetical protein